MEKQNVDAKAAEVREKLEDESLDKCKVAGGMKKAHKYNTTSSSSSGK